MHQWNEAAPDGCETAESGFARRHRNRRAGIHHLHEFFQGERDEVLPGPGEKDGAGCHRVCSLCSSLLMRWAILPTGST